MTPIQSGLTRMVKGSNLLRKMISSVEALSYPSHSRIFPLGADALWTVIKEPVENERDIWEQTFSPQLEQAATENPFALDYLMRMGENTSSSGISDYLREFRVGVAIMYATLKQKAGDQAIPVLTDQFTDRFHYLRATKIREKYGPSEEGINRGDSIERYERYTSFRLSEKNLYNTLAHEMGGEAREDDFFHTPTYDGIVLTYFLFAEGLSDSQNWQGLQNFGKPPVDPNIIH